MPRALWEHDLQWAQWTAVVAACLVGAVWDVRQRRIPNWLTGPALLAGLVWGLSVARWPGLGDAALGMLISALPCVVLFVLAGGGAGDAKLMAAAGAWLGVINSLVALAAVSVCGIVMALIWAAASKRLRRMSGDVAAGVGRMVFVAKGLDPIPNESVEDAPPSRRLMMPYGVAICVGMAVAATGVMLWRI